MKTYKKYAFRGINIMCLVLTIVSFMGLRESIQEERKLQNKKGYAVFVSSAVLPSTPRIIKVPKATVKKPVVKPVTKDTSNEVVQATYTGNISYYASDCRGCNGKTATGYNIEENIYYYDKTYGTLHIVAADSKLPFGTVLRIQSGTKVMHAIVLDRGGAIGFGRKYLLDVVCESEQQAYQLGVIKNATVEVLRIGY